jgi:dihydropyrimidinase
MAQLHGIITNATVVTATNTQQADIWWCGERIHQIAPNLQCQRPQWDVSIDGTGLFALPGGIDPHTHLEMPFMGTTSSDDFETGTRAALHGGTTTIIDFAMQRKGQTLFDTYHLWRDKAAKAVADYSFHVAVTDLNPDTLAEVPRLISEEGIRSFKVFMAYKQALMVGDEALLALLATTAKHGAKVLAHCEHGDMIDWLVQQTRASGADISDPRHHALTRPPLVEAEATGRFCDLAYLTGGLPYIVHLSCEEALQRLRFARQRGQQVWAETCIQYLTLDDSLYDRPDAAKWVFSPPLRSQADQHALWHALAQGELDTVATDHCPFCLPQKAMGADDFTRIPNGMPGIEHRLELLYSEGVATGQLSVNDWVRVSSTAAAQAFDLYPRKGSLDVGADADIVLFDPNARHTLGVATHHMQCDYSAFEGREVQGKVAHVVRRGEWVLANGQLTAERGSGQFLPRFARL